MISLQTSLRHMSWADDKLFAEVRNLPIDRLQLCAHDPEWTVARTLMHVLQGVQWYRFLLLGAHTSELQIPRTADDVESLRVKLAQMNESLVEAAGEPDAMIEFEDESGPRRAPRSVVLSQAPYHAAEHRAGVVAILHSHGERSIHLDDYDVWAWYDSTAPAQTSSS